jgi:photoactive yellow protein
MVRDPNKPSARCAWCATELKRGGLNSPMSHGICLACMSAAAGNPIEDLSRIAPELLDTLRSGAIQLSGEGIVTAYSTGESLLSGLTPASAVGKDFFQQVAPSTAVKEFRGKFEALRSKGPGRPCYTTLRFQLCWRRNAC